MKRKLLNEFLSDEDVTFIQTKLVEKIKNTTQYNVEPTKTLHRGTQGLILNILNSDWLLMKITTDYTEAKACAYIKNKSFENVYEIDKVFSFKDFPRYYCIVQEKLEPINLQYITEIYHKDNKSINGHNIKTVNKESTQIVDVMNKLNEKNTDFFLNYEYLKKVFSHKESIEIFKKILMWNYGNMLVEIYGKLTNNEMDILILLNNMCKDKSFYFSSKESVNYITDIMNGLNELKKYNVIFTDLHADNTMQRITDKHYVIIDIGLSMSPEGNIPIYEKKSK